MTDRDAAHPSGALPRDADGKLVLDSQPKPERPLPDITLLLFLAQLWNRGVTASIHWDVPIMESGDPPVECRAITVRVQADQLEAWRSLRVASTGDGSPFALEGWREFAEATAISWGEVWQGIRDAIPASSLEETRSRLRAHLDQLSSHRSIPIHDQYLIPAQWLEELRSLIG